MNSQNKKFGVHSATAYFNRNNMTSPVDNRCFIQKICCCLPKKKKLKTYSSPAVIRTEEVKQKTLPSIAHGRLVSTEVIDLRKALGE